MALSWGTIVDAFQKKTSRGPCLVMNRAGYISVRRAARNSREALDTMESIFRLILSTVDKIPVDCRIVAQIP